MKSTDPLAPLARSPFSRGTNGSLLPFAQRHVQQNGNDNYAANDDLLGKRRSPKEVQTVAQHADDQRTNERSQDGSFTTEQAGAADHSGRNGVQFIHDTGN